MKTPRQFMRFLSAPMLLLALAGTATAGSNAAPAGAGPVWNGLWSGTIGGKQVMVCLDTPEEDGTSASGYYYLSHGEKIPLVASARSGSAWVEGSREHSSGAWTLDSMDDASLRGYWTTPTGTRRTALTLRRVAATPDQDSASWWDTKALCRSTAFYGPRADAEQLVAGAIEHKQGIGYRELYTRSMYSRAQHGGGPFTGNAVVELLDVGSGIAKINRFLRARWRTRLARSYIHEQGGLAEFSENLDFATPRWLTLYEMEWTDGYGISGSASWHETWSLQTGTKVDLWSWFNAAGGSWEIAESAPEFHPSASLLKVIRRFQDTDDECKESDGGARDPRLAPDGMTFSFGDGPCLRQAIVPFQNLRPYLKQEALAEIKLLKTKAP